MICFYSFTNSGGPPCSSTSILHSSTSHPCSSSSQVQQCEDNLQQFKENVENIRPLQTDVNALHVSNYPNLFREFKEQQLQQLRDEREQQGIDWNVQIDSAFYFFLSHI